MDLAARRRPSLGLQKYDGTEFSQLSLGLAAMRRVCWEISVGDGSCNTVWRNQYDSSSYM